MEQDAGMLAASDRPLEPGDGLRFDTQTNTDADGPWQLYVADDDGTWHEVSALRLVTLNRKQVADLEDLGDESVLEDCAGVRLLDVLRAHIYTDDRTHWT